MDSLEEQRRQSFNSYFATLAAILAIGHYIVLGSSISFAQRLNDFSILISSSYVDNLYVHLNIPFATALALLATVQLGSSLAILSFNRNRAAATMLHYASLAGLVASFAASSLVTTTAIEYTLNIGQWPKVSTLYPGAQSFYRWLEIDATANCLFAVPSLFYIFYNNIEVHLSRQESTRPLIENNFWIIGLFINAAAHIVFIIFVGSYIQQQDAVSNDYYQETQLSRYIFFMAIESAISIAAFLALNLHFQPLPFGKSHLFKAWMTSKQLIVATSIPIFFSSTVILLTAIKAIQLNIDKATNTKCWLSIDCDKQQEMMIQCYIFLGLTICTTAILGVKLRDFSANINTDDETDKLLTTEYRV